MNLSLFAVCPSNHKEQSQNRFQFYKVKKAVLRARYTYNFLFSMFFPLLVFDDCFDIYFPYKASFPSVTE